MVFSICIPILIEHYVSQLWRPWASESGSALFADAQQKGSLAYREIIAQHGGKFVATQGTKSTCMEVDVQIQIQTFRVS